jgi:hypothetical protein
MRTGTRRLSTVKERYFTYGELHRKNKEVVTLICYLVTTPLGCALDGFKMCSPIKLLRTTGIT